MINIPYVKYHVMFNINFDYTIFNVIIVLVLTALI